MIEVTENELTITTPGQYFELSKCTDGDLYLHIDTDYSLVHNYFSIEQATAIRDFITRHLKEHEQKEKAES